MEEFVGGSFIPCKVDLAFRFVIHRELNPEQMLKNQHILPSVQQETREIDLILPLKKEILSTCLILFTKLSSLQVKTAMSENSLLPIYSGLLRTQWVCATIRVLFLLVVNREQVALPVMVLVISFLCTLGSLQREKLDFYKETEKFLLH